METWEIMVRKESERGEGCTYKKEVVNKIYFNVFARMYVENESDSRFRVYLEKKGLVTAKDAEKIKNE
jgi:hypothetical protein